jgi:hypothetical protein
MKEINNLFHLQLELRAVRKNRLRYAKSTIIERIFTLRSLRPKYRFAGGSKSHGGHRIPDLYSKRLIRIFYYFFQLY